MTNDSRVVGDVSELFLFLLPLLLFLVDVAGHWPAQPGFDRVGPPADTHQHLCLFPQVLVDAKDQDGHQGEVDEPEPDEYRVPRAQPSLSYLMCSMFCNHHNNDQQ